MKFNEVLEKLEKQEVIALATATAKEKKLQWNKNIEVILTACCVNIILAPKLGGKQDDEKQAIAFLSIASAVDDFATEQ